MAWSGETMELANLPSTAACSPHYLFMEPCKMLPSTERRAFTVLHAPVCLIIWLITKRCTTPSFRPSYVFLCLCLRHTSQTIYWINVAWWHEHGLWVRWFHTYLYTYICTWSDKMQIIWSDTYFQWCDKILIRSDTMYLAAHMLLGYWLISSLFLRLKKARPIPTAVYIYEFFCSFFHMAQN